MSVIKTNIKEVAKGLSDFEKKQIPYATSVALNNTAEISMKIMKSKIDKEFNITSSWNKVGGKYGIKKKRATKNNLEVEIYIPNENKWIDDHEKGDTRNSVQLIPTKGFKKLYGRLRTNRSIKKKATTLLSNKSKYRIFEAPLKTGYGTMAIFQRLKGKVQGKRRLRSTKTGRLLKAKKVLRQDVVPLFIIKESVKEKAILHFHETVLDSVKNNINKEFDKAIGYAIKTSK